MWLGLMRIWKHVNKMMDKPSPLVQSRELRQQMNQLLNWLQDLLNWLKDLLARIRPYASYESEKEMTQDLQTINVINQEHYY